jgi:hypothetical protein
MYISLFHYCISSGFFFVYFPLHVHVYIRASCPHMNTTAIHNMVSEPKIRVSVCSSLSLIDPARRTCVQHLLQTVLFVTVFSTSVLMDELVLFVAGLPRSSHR